MPWNTKPGGSRLDAEIQAILERKAHGGPAYLHNEIDGYPIDAVDAEEKAATPTTATKV